MLYKILFIESKYFIINTSTLTSYIYIYIRDLVTLRVTLKKYFLFLYFIFLKI